MQVHGFLLFRLFTGAILSKFMLISWTPEVKKVNKRYLVTVFKSGKYVVQAGKINKYFLHPQTYQIQGYNKQYKIK